MSFRFIKFEYASIYQPQFLLIILFSIICLLTLFSYNGKKFYLLHTNEGKIAYLVNEKNCKIPKLMPFNMQAFQFYNPQGYLACTDKPPLSVINKTENGSFFLQMDTKSIKFYSTTNIKCCYSIVRRLYVDSGSDDDVEVYNCIPFIKTEIKDEIVIVKCTEDKYQDLVYENVHLIINKKKVKHKINKLNKHNLNILFIGIDSISKLNFIRTMPKTFNYVETNNWIPLHGYNKIEDNTFPNLMAILTGLNMTKAFEICKPETVDGLNNCPLFWYDLKKLGYVTAFGEDINQISTFNYYLKGFNEEPTDFYLRPYVLATEKLSVLKVDDLTYCTGPETAGERIINAAKDFVFTFKDYQNFGFFWMNHFSHNEINSPSRFDNKITTFLNDLSVGGILNSTIVIFLSDHGIRFGDIRLTFTGWLEERLPFIYISVPDWFKNVYKNEYINLLNNRNKLTTPYDLYLTVQHIVQLSGINYTVKHSDGCPNCKSLFQNIDKNRRCKDVAIEPHWCTCFTYYELEFNEPIVNRVVTFSIKEIEKIILKAGIKLQCSPLSLNRVIASRITNPPNYDGVQYVLVVFETTPKAVFESTVILGDNLSLVGSISRLDEYSSKSFCIDDRILKKYCNCINEDSLIFMS